MKDWFTGLQKQERITVLSGAIALLMMLFYVAIWDPINSGVEELEKSVARQGPLLDWMRQAAVDVKKLTGSKSAPKSTAGQSLLSLIDSTAKKGGLGSALKRVKPEGNNKVSVWLEEASFDDAVKWMEQLNRSYAIEVSSLVIDRKETPGRIDSRIVFVSL